VAIAGVPLTCNQSCEAMLPKGDNNADYLYYLLRLIRPILERFGAGTTFTSITRRDFRDIRIALPKPVEQGLIAKVLICADDAISDAETRLAAVLRFKAALSQQLFARGIPGRHHLTKETRVGVIPTTWEVTKLKKCGEWGSGGTPDRENLNFWGGTIPWVKSGEVNYRLISETEERITEAGAASINGELLGRGTLLVAMYGAGVTRGKAALLGVDAYVNQAIAYFKGNEDTDNEWLLYWFERHYEIVRTLASGANQDNLSLYLIKNLYIARPPREEQTVIVFLLRKASEAIATAEEAISALKCLKLSLCRNLLTGKVRVRV